MIPLKDAVSGVQELLLLISLYSGDIDIQVPCVDNIHNRN